MIICIDVSQRTKDSLEKLLQTGGYRDYSEAVEVAIANQLLLQNHVPERPLRPNAAAEITSAEHSGEQGDGNGLPNQTVGTFHVPTLFSVLNPARGASNFAPYPTDNFSPGADIAVDRWIFGQHNKLLPLKATCRALARLTASGSPGSLALSKTAAEIASEAVKLGDYLKHLDESSGVHRDDSLSFAFPFSKSPNGDKSRLRYANQFVASFTTQGNLTGLPIEFKLANRDQSRNPQILLTEAGWLFAGLPNPILDGPKNGRQSKFSNDEIQFLLQHIRTRVPAEAFAYTVIFNALTEGANTPGTLDDALQEYLPQRDAKPFTRAFLTTQRAGVVSRMIDLGLIRRVRDGITVTYIPAGTHWESLLNATEAS